MAELTLEGLYEVAKEKGLLAPGWQSSGKCIWNALHVVLLQAARSRRDTEREEILWFEALLDSLDDGDEDAVRAAIEAAIKLRQRQLREAK